MISIYHHFWQQTTGFLLTGPPPKAGDSVDEYEAKLKVLMQQLQDSAGMYKYSSFHLIFMRFSRLSIEIYVGTYTLFIYIIKFLFVWNIYECIYTSQGSSWLLSEVEPKFLVQVPTFLQDPSAAAHAVPTFWNSLSPANRVQFEKDFPQFMKLGLRTVKACERHLANVEN